MSKYTLDTQIHFGYIVFNEGTGNEQVRVLVAASAEGLEAQARLMKLRLRSDDYINCIDDLVDYDQECIAELEE